MTVRSSKVFGPVSTRSFTSTVRLMEAKYRSMPAVRLRAPYFRFRFPATAASPQAACAN
ncbi:MAG: hypothetical protein IKD79_00760 [Oscillospiraceae bacterium]|nr:hypothetical protein [Oscillospiraceae bacterium]